MLRKIIPVVLTIASLLSIVYPGNESHDANTAERTCSVTIANHPQRSIGVTSRLIIELFR